MMQTAPAAAAVVKALRATEKRMAESLSKNKKINYSSTNLGSPLNTRKKQNASQTEAMILKNLWEEGES